MLYCIRLMLFIFSSSGGKKKNITHTHSHWSVIDAISDFFLSFLRTNGVFTAMFTCPKRVINNANGFTSACLRSETTSRTNERRTGRRRWCVCASSSAWALTVLLQTKVTLKIWNIHQCFRRAWRLWYGLTDRRLELLLIPTTNFTRPHVFDAHWFRQFKLDFQKKKYQFLYLFFFLGRRYIKHTSLVETEKVRVITHTQTNSIVDLQWLVCVCICVCVTFIDKHQKLFYVEVVENVVSVWYQQSNDGLQPQNTIVVNSITAEKWQRTRTRTCASPHTPTPVFLSVSTNWFS